MNHFGTNSAESRFYGTDPDTLAREKLIEDFEDTLIACATCGGTGCIDTPTSDDDPCCPDCDGEGEVEA